MKKLLLGIVTILALSSCSAYTGTIQGDSVYRCKNVKETKGCVKHKFQTDKKKFVFKKQHFILESDHQLYEVGERISF